MSILNKSPNPLARLSEDQGNVRTPWFGTELHVTCNNWLCDPCLNMNPGIKKRICDRLVQPIDSSPLQHPWHHGLASWPKLPQVAHGCAQTWNTLLTWALGVQILWNALEEDPA